MDSVALGISVVAAAIALVALVGSHWGRPHDPAGATPAADPRLVDWHEMVICELVREVLALREDKLEELEGPEATEARARYARIYRDIAIIGHDSSGLTPGAIKLVNRFRGFGLRHVDTFDRRAMSELAVLRRLGEPEGEIVRYRREAEEARYYT